LLVLPNFATPFKNPNCASGRHTIVHLFEWRWNDIAAECERFLGPMKYCGVQISPPNEHIMIQKPHRPWWERYQPVSYKLISRSGNENEFKDMVKRCNRVNVRIYADVVINHMVGAGQSGRGIGGSSYDSGEALSFPAVPFSAWDFNSKSDCGSQSGNIESYQDARQVRNCRLVSLVDLKSSKDYVRSKNAEFMNSMIDAGVAGFRIDAAKHMWPGDLKNIYGRLKNLRSDVFGSNRRPFVFQEVIDMGGESIKASEYSGIARVTEFRFSRDLSRVFNGDVNLKYLRNFGSGWGFAQSNDAVVFLDNHDNQRGHGGAGSILTFRSSKKYKAATAFKLALPYGFSRIMSSYDWNVKNDWQGPPSNHDGATNSVPINKDSTCGGGWICEHRWRQIYGMVKFRNVVFGQDMSNWWDNGHNQIAFSRGNRGFLAINNNNGDLRQHLATGMDAGRYCDIISGLKSNNKTCTGKTITVGNDRRAYIEIRADEEDAMVAIHAESKL